jgi:hypothetical protein
VKGIGRGFMSQTEAERRSVLAGTNLFFGALLGAHLGTMDEVPIYDYLFLILLLGGAVTGIMMIAVSNRWRVVWVTLIMYVVLLGSVILSPDLLPAHMRGEIERIAVMFVVWLLILAYLRVLPVIPEESEAASPSAPMRIDDEA